MDDVLDRFSAPTRAWFEGAFAAPTPAQRGAWEAISAGEHVLVVAPTGSGKTLSAFLWALDRLAAQPAPADPLRRCRVLYVSPLKALAVDIERNLRAPLTGIRQAATRLGAPMRDVTVGVRSGDTGPAQRRTLARTPPDVLITTPESVFLLLTSAAREALRGIDTVIVDEVHAVAASKRGAHLALSLERLDALLDSPAQRIGLSATVRPVDEVGRFLTGARPLRIVAPPSAKQVQLQVVVPVPDLASMGEPTDDLSGPAAADPRRTSIWPHVEERVVDLIAAHRSTLVFANSRRLAERLTARLNEIWAQRQLDAADQPTASLWPAAPAQLMAQAGASSGAPPVLARAHHGSVSKEQRALIEDELKSGRLRAVVATSSLELGIDMGAVDLVVQVESPPSVASGLQRVGRAGHQVGALSRGVIFPKFRADLVQSAVVVERMQRGQIENLHVPANPLDVLAQQIVAMVAMDDWPLDDLQALVRRSAPFAGLPRSALEAVLDMLAGRYPSEEFAQLRPRLVWDRVHDVLTGRPGAQGLAVTSGGTIPDRGLFAVFLATGSGPGRRVGELDEEMVYESRPGDVFALGTSSWRIEEITHDQVLVTPAPGEPAKLPFWRGDTLGRPAELGGALGAFVREVGAASPAQARERLGAAGLDEWAADNLLAYLGDQRAATGHVADDRTIVVERFRDELGDWRVVVHSPFGAPVHAPWALMVAARMRERYGVDVQAMHADDGLVLRLPDLALDDAAALDDAPALDLTELLVVDPADVEALVTAQLGGSALFASRFRECAGRALLLPRRRPGARAALWQQRQRSAALLEVAARYPSFPIVLEAVRECLQDVFDVPALRSLMRDLADRQVRLVQVQTQTPSPFARSLLFGYVAQFLYEGDSPLAERRAAALSLDPALLAELLGRGEGAALRDLLDPQAVARTERELQRLDENLLARHGEDLADLLRALGPLTLQEVAQRSRDPAAAPGWLAELERSRRAIQVRIAGGEHWCAIEDAGRLQNALGVALPLGIPAAFLEPGPDPLTDLLARYARTHGPFTVAAAAARFGLGAAAVAPALRLLVAAGRLVEGELRPDETGPDVCDAQVLRLLRRRSLALLRSQVEPVSRLDFARFLPHWQGVGSELRGTEGVLSVVEQLAGAVLPASALESLVLPARVVGWSPRLLDELTLAGEVLWCGHGALPGDDGWVSLHLRDTAALTMPEPAELELSQAHRGILAALDGGGGYFFRALSDAIGATDDQALSLALWDLVWAGRISGDSLAPLRARLAGGRTAHRRAAGPRHSRYSRPGRLGARIAARPALPTRVGPPETAGRWSLLTAVEPDPTLRAAAAAELLIDRHGVLTRGAASAERTPGGFGATYRVLRALEEAGRVRRGYFVEGLGAAQFASAAAVDRLRADPKATGATRTAPSPALVLAACDPANPYGAALPWPQRAAPASGGPPPGSDEPGAAGGPGPSSAHRPARKAGAVVVLSEGALVLYVERGGRSLLSFSDDPATLSVAADALALAVREGALGRLTVQRADGDALLGSGHPLAVALGGAGFLATPRGLQLRR